MPPTERFLYRWQLEALVRWLECGRRGVVEAVTGSGKTNVALAAAADAHRRGLFVLVVVPSRVLMEQWYERLSEALPNCSIGRLGDNSADRPAQCDVLVTTRHSAASRQPKPPGDMGGLLIADECHGFGGGVLRKSLMKDYSERLGLTATLERSDDAVDTILLPYFGGLCYRYDFAAAIADGVCAQPRVAFVAVPLTQEEREDYIATEQQLVQARQLLRRLPGMPQSPFGDFLAAVSYLSKNDAGANGRAANDYLDAFSKRRDIVAVSTAKYEALGNFGPSIKTSDGALIFTETVRAANHAINRLDPHVAIEIITGSTGKRDRERILTELRTGDLDAVAAPRVLDEGVDVPDANLGVVVSASRTRRQMIQRMGRILRRKQAGSGARFVIIFARDTLEDPRMSEERDGFIDEIDRISESAMIFDEHQLDELTDFLDYTGPAEVIEPRRVGGIGAAPTDSIAELDSDTVDALHDADPTAWAAVAESVDLGKLLTEVSAETVYAYLSFLDWAHITPLHEAAWNTLVFEPEEDPEDAPYVEVEQAFLPEIETARKKTVKKRMSTGENPLTLSKTPKGFILQCTGCGSHSDPTPYRWKALDETVECECH